MNKALDDCFGKGEIVNYQNLEELKDVLTNIYDDLELQSLSGQIESRLVISDTNGSSENHTNG